MKNNKVMFFCIIAIAIVGIFTFLQAGTKPLKNLDEETVVKIEITPSMPDKTKIVEKKEDIQKIVERMRNIVIYSKVEKNEYAGQSLTFTIFFTDGSTRTVVESNPLFMLDGQFYETKYEPAEKLGRLYIDLDAPERANATLPTNLPDLFDLPRKYSSSAAIENGDFVVIHGKIENKQLLTSFLEGAENGQEAFLRTTQYTTEGDAIIIDIKYENNAYQVIVDSTRDVYAEEEARSYSYLSYENMIQQKNDNTIDFYLYNGNQFSEEMAAAENQQALFLFSIKEELL